MKNFILVLKVISPIFLLVGLLHLTLGLNAEVLLGANIADSTISNPVLDSQNRFYGVCFALYGALFYLCSTDLEKYQTVLKYTLWFFFFGGLARLVSIAVTGLPSPLILALLLTELLLPPALLLWFSRLESSLNH